MNRFVRSCQYGILIAGLVVGLEARATGDAARGVKVFPACVACHSVKPGEHMTGPSLAHIWNRKTGTVEDFLRYSDAMKKANVVWTETNLDKWLANPQRFLPGTSMSFTGIQETKDRQDVIAYLQSVSEGKAPVGARQGMMGRKNNRKQAPPEGQATAPRWSLPRRGKSATSSSNHASDVVQASACSRWRLKLAVKSGVRDALHCRMKPLRRDRSLGPRTALARRI